MPGPITPCLVIPCYNHGALLVSVIERLAPLSLPCIVVDDGSDSATRFSLEKIEAEVPWVSVIKLQQNSGKGVAVIAGIKQAAVRGFSHAIQVDADGQHSLEDIPKLLALAEKYPDGLISGQPIYDNSIPKARLYGRWITHFWVWVETLSFSIKDSMCGFRIYPINPVLRVCDSKLPGRRMDFDTEIMVRLYWLGYDSYFIRTRVTYPEEGISHFDTVRDNLRISRMHTQLFFGMLLRIPSLLKRHKKHWGHTPELRGKLGMKSLLLIRKLLGKRCCEALLYPIIAGYLLFAPQARRASKEWIFNVKNALGIEDKRYVKTLTPYRHFMAFGKSILERISCWQGETTLSKDVVFAQGSEACFKQFDGRGVLLLASHLGNIEACRALANQATTHTIHAIVFHEHAQAFKEIMDEIAPDSSVNLLPVTNMGPDTAIFIDEKIKQGDWVAIVGDRIAVNAHRKDKPRVIWSQFLNRPAPFPQGPFILASALKCPVVTLFAIHQQKKLTIFAEVLAEKIDLPRHYREQALQTYVDRYAQRLEYYALLSPLEWFNFFDFWHLPHTEIKDSSHE
ncbi:glycosyltransferase family 2 protein [Rosenbergiella epipactidis]|uniref:glycosyltransferase family 2 protein n=1 Tax=Rosenbergiella epipactidis TaxID=1544694 RepID=UPI001F4F0481|nr:glycosyltransferase family 2 protein [Rosenbergiella epipactidis]